METVTTPVICLGEKDRRANIMVGELGGQQSLNPAESFEKRKLHNLCHPVTC
jgi:hypothetical protein